LLDIRDIEAATDETPGRNALFLGKVLPLNGLEYWTSWHRAAFITQRISRAKSDSSALLLCDRRPMRLPDPEGHRFREACHVPRRIELFGKYVFSGT
jgi:hypothetical protein